MELPNLKAKAGSRVQEDVFRNMAGEVTQEAGEERDHATLLSVTIPLMVADVMGRAELSRLHVPRVILRSFCP